jgi:hypothetical protein
MALIAITGLSALPAEAQTSNSAAGKKTAAPARWQEKWVGMYEGQDRAGKVAPPGFKVLHPPEPDTIELVESLLQPWAKARGKSTSYELEDPGQICRPTGPLRGNSTSEFELLASLEKITIIGGTGGGILTGGIRRIYLNRPHLKNPPLTYYGDSIAHWEGETLVLDAIGFNEKTWFTRDPQRHTESLHISERWKFVADDKWLEKTITVDDRFALTAQFTVTRYFEKLPDSTPQPERLCLDTPEARRAWLKLYRQYEQDYESERKNMGSKVNLTEER